MAARNLPDPWRVFWHVEWQGQRAGQQADGEADFVLLHPGVGLVFLEVKGGGIAVGDGHWYSFDRHGQRHELGDPFEQAKTSKYEIIRQLKSDVAELGYVPAGHAVAFPDLRSSEKLGVNAPPELMICRPDLSNIQKVVSRVVSHWELDANLAPTVVTKISDVLAPQKELRRTLSDEVAESDAQIDFWTNEQLEALDALARNSRQIIYGGAGTGKTVLAKEKARRLVAEGKSVLLTCFNGPLAAAMKDELGAVAAVDVATFHGLCRRLASVAGNRRTVGPSDASDAGYAAAPEIGRGGFDFPRHPSRSFWDDGAPDLLVRAAEAIGYQVDAVVVDEGQDFAPTWWSALELLLAEPGLGEFYVFADTHQAIYRQEWEPPFGGPSYELIKNCRNTLPIAERVAAIFGDNPASLGATGADPTFIEVGNQDGAVKALRSLLHTLLNEGKLSPIQVAVLCQRKEDQEVLAGLELAGAKLVESDQWGDGVLVETIHRFKGLESDVAVVLLWDTDRSWDRSLAYIGVSRPRAQLYVLGPRNVKTALSWSDGS